MEATAQQVEQRETTTPEWTAAKSGTGGDGGNIDDAGIDYDCDTEDDGGGIGGSISECSAIHVVVNVSWDPKPLDIVLGGSGELHMWFKLQLVADGTRNPDGSYDLTSTSRMCGLILPDVEKGAIAGGGMARTNYPDQVWDSPSMPETVSTVTISGNRSDAAISMEWSGWAVGLTMADVLSDPWPDTGQNVLPYAVDADGDGNPGITRIPNGTEPYRLPGVGLIEMLSGPYADRLYEAIRLVMQLKGVRTSCTTAVGEPEVFKFDTHVIGCRLDTAAECSAIQAQFLDDNRTIYDVDNATYEMVQVDDNATCGDVRAALPVQ